MTLAAGVLTLGSVGDAVAAKSGGRVGGQAFRPSAPRSAPRSIETLKYIKRGSKFYLENSKGPPDVWMNYRNPQIPKRKKKIKLTCKVPHHRVKQIKSQCWLADATLNFHFSSKANEIFEEIICVLYTFWKVFRTSKVNNRKSRNKFYFTPGKTFVFIKLNEFDRSDGGELDRWTVGIRVDLMLVTVWIRGVKKFWIVELWSHFSMRSCWLPRRMWWDEITETSLRCYHVDRIQVCIRCCNKKILCAANMTYK